MVDESHGNARGGKSEKMTLDSPGYSLKDSNKTPRCRRSRNYQFEGDNETRPDTRPISSRWRVGRGSTLRGRGSQSVGRGCILGGQGLLCSEITNTVNFAASEISRDGHPDRPRDTPSYRVA